MGQLVRFMRLKIYFKPHILVGWLVQINLSSGKKFDNSNLIVMKQGSLLKFSSKSKIHIFPLTCSAILSFKILTYSSFFFYPLPNIMKLKGS